MYNDFVCSVCNEVKKYQDDYFEKIKLCWTCYKKKLVTQGKKEKVSKYYSCECGTEVLRKHKQRHFRSDKHKRIVSQ